MKNAIQLVLVLSMIVGLGLGCSLLRRDQSNPESNGSNRSLTDKTVDKTVGRSNIGVPECDEVMDAIEAELNNSDDNFVVKAAKATFLNRIKDSIRESVEKNPNDKEELAKTCREFKAQFDKYKAEEQSQKAN